MAFDKTLYSDPVLDLEIVACFHELQDVKLTPKKTATPPVDRQSYEHPTQSVLENALSTIDFDLLILKLVSYVYCKYRRIYLTVVQ